MKKIIALFAVIMSVSSISRADIMIEPYLGYEMGTTKNTDGKLTGTQLGARLGYSTPVMLWVAADYTLGMSGTWDPDSGNSQDVKRSTLYGVIGVDLPVLLRAWLGVSLMDEVKFESAKYKGSATKIGFGFTGFPFISLNFEYLNEKFNERDGQSYSPNTENNSYVLSVSLPVDL